MAASPHGSCVAVSVSDVMCVSKACEWLGGTGVTLQTCVKHVQHTTRTRTPPLPVGSAQAGGLQPNATPPQWSCPELTFPILFPPPSGLLLGALGDSVQRKAQAFRQHSINSYWRSHRLDES